MGATNFFEEAKGQTAEEAFIAAVEEAHYFYGHGGYSGSIAEKNRFKEIDIPNEWEDKPYNYAYKLIKDNDKRIADKWGPAGCILLEKGKDENTYLFFGWASS